METAFHHNSSEFNTISDKILSPVQAQVIAALAQGRTATDAALQAGIHRTTIHGWFRDLPVFKTAFQEAQREYVETLHDGLRDLAARAVETLRSLLDDPATPPSVRLRTALAVLQRPRFPKPGWTLPERVETLREQDVIDQLAEVEADFRSMRMTEALMAHEKQQQKQQEKQQQAPASTPIARSAPCPCGSGDKYKRCCGKHSAGKFTPPASGVAA